jgi:hypothetical protein
MAQKPAIEPFLNQSLLTPELEPVPMTTTTAESPEVNTGLRSLIRDQSTQTEFATLESPKAALRPQKLEASPTPEDSWMKINGVSILDAPNNLAFQPTCETGEIELPEFRVIPWSEDVLTSGAFNVTKKTAVAWEHLGFTGYWIHSGVDWLGKPLAAFPLQDYLEKIDPWKVRTAEEFNQHASNCLVGGKVTLSIGEDILEGKVTAVVRIPVTEIDVVSSHVMDLVPNLAKTYPKSGFDKLKAPELLLYFCGKRLTYEMEDKAVPYYAQSRIIVAIDFETQQDSQLVPKSTLKNLPTPQGN